MSVTPELDPLFNPKSVALVGASKSIGKYGSTTLFSMITGGYKGKIYPVNPKGGKIQGLTVYPELSEISDDIDLVVICIPSEKVLPVIEESVDVGVKTGVIITSGFGEVDERGKEIEREMAKTAREGGMRFIGPNCMGMASAVPSLYVMMNMMIPRHGNVSVVSQSGTLGTLLMMAASGQGVGFNKFVSSGNEADLHMEDIIEYYAQDPETKAIFAFIEGVREGRRFIEVSKETTKRKPFVVLKAGATEAGMKAASSHTGALAGSNVMYDTVFTQSGITRARDSRDSIDLIKAFSLLNIPKGKRVGILTAGGGAGVLAADACGREGLEVPDLPEESIEELNEFLPPFWSHGNPIDITASGANASSGMDLSVMTRPLETLLRCDDIDSVICMTPSLSTMVEWMPKTMRKVLKSMPLANIEEGMTRKFIELKEKYDKPIVIMGFPGQGSSNTPLEDGGIPIYESPEQAAHVLSSLIKYGEYRESFAKFASNGLF